MTRNIFKFSRISYIALALLCGLAHSATVEERFGFLAEATLHSDENGGYTLTSEKLPNGRVAVVLAPEFRPQQPLGVFSVPLQDVWIEVGPKQKPVIVGMLEEKSQMRYATQWLGRFLAARLYETRQKIFEKDPKAPSANCAVQLTATIH